MTYNAEIAAVRPEVAAGAILRDDGEIHFFTRVNALLLPDMTVLDFGAGRGAIFDSGEFAYRERLAKLQGKVKKVIGVDVDNGILEHPFLDERHLIDVGRHLPIADSSVDVIVAHWVFEHVQDPDQLACEFLRILKPGGWVCGRTPHRWSYIGIVVTLMPDKIQRTLLRHLKPEFGSHDKFPTAYRMNSRSALAKFFPRPHWENYSYGLNSTPRYYFNSRLVLKLMSAVQYIAWPKVDLIVLLRKRG